MIPIAKYFNLDSKPPKQGWRVVIQGVEFEANDEGSLIDGIRKWRKRNSTFVSDLDIEREIWAILCARDPKRCRQSGESTNLQPATPRELTKEFVGPILWKTLNIAAATWTPESHAHFMAFLDYILFLLECPICRSEWREILSIEKPIALSSRFAVCSWVNRVHNAINARIGKSEYPYARMISEFGAPPA